MTVFLFTGFLAVQTPVPFNNPDQEALRYGTKALFYELELDQQIKQLEKQYMSEELRKNGVIIGAIGRLALEKRISYTWRF